MGGSPAFYFCLLSFYIHLFPFSLQRHIPMLSCRHLNPFIIKCIQRRQDFFTCDRRINYLIYISAFISNKGVCNFITIFFYELFFKFNRVYRFSKFFSIENCNSSIRTHYGNLCRWPGKTEIATKVFTVHNNKCSSVSLPEYYCNFRNSCFTISEKQFGAMSYNACMFLVNTRQESWNIFECYYGYIKGIAKPDKPCALCR